MKEPATFTSPELDIRVPPARQKVAYSAPPSACGFPLAATFLDAAKESIFVRNQSSLEDEEY